MFEVQSRFAKWRVLSRYSLCTATRSDWYMYFRLRNLAIRSTGTSRIKPVQGRFVRYCLYFIDPVFRQACMRHCQA